MQVENCLRGNSFPIIIADENICRELRDLESEFEGSGNENLILHFLNELGWLFQRTNQHSYHYCTPDLGGHIKDFSNTRFKFLLNFSIERDWLCLVTKLLDIYIEPRSLGISNDGGGYAVDDFVLLSEIDILSQAIKRKCNKMVEMLLNYTIKIGSDRLIVYLFPPNHKGQANITPLHLAASMQVSECLVNTLTSDPQQVTSK